MQGTSQDEVRRFHDTKPWFRRGVEVGRKILKRWGSKPRVLEKFLEAAQYHQGWLKLVDPPKIFPPTLTGPVTDEGLGGLGEEGFSMVEAVIAHHLGRKVDEDALEEIRLIEKAYPVNASSKLRKQMAPGITTAELNGSTAVLLVALKRCYEHLSEANLVQAIAKLKWAQQYGPHGNRTNAFDPEGEPLRLSGTLDHWEWALGFNNAGVGNYKALMGGGYIEKNAKHDPSRNEYQKKYQKKRYHGRKKQAIDMLGGKCSVCGTTRGLELDHKNPDTKSFNVTKLWSVPEAEFKREVRKCKLLCKKHHRERTSKQRENGDVKSIPGKTQYDSKGRKTKTRKKKAANYFHLASRVAGVIRDHE